MSIYAGAIIEQQKTNDQRFRITLPESALDQKAIMEGIVIQAGHLTSLAGAEQFTRMMKRQVVGVACNQLSDHPAVSWAKKHGGRMIVRQFEEKSRGDRTYTIFQQAGVPLPQIVNDHYRAGLSITFKERDKAMLFKLRWLATA